MVWWSIIWFGKVGKLVKYLVLGNQVECSTFMSKPFVVIGVYTGWSGLGLCLTWNRLAHIGWKVEQPTVDYGQSWVELDQSPMDNDQVGRSWSEFQPPGLRRIFTGSLQDLLIFLRICVTTTRSKQKPPPQAQICAKTSISSPDLSEKN